MVGQKHQTKHGKNAKKEVRKTIRNKLDITDDIEIDRCHLMGKSQRSKSKPQAVVCKFLCMFQRQAPGSAKCEKVKRHRNLHL